MVDVWVSRKGRLRVLMLAAMTVPEKKPLMGPHWEQELG